MKCLPSRTHHCHPFLGDLPPAKLERVLQRRAEWRFGWQRCTFVYVVQFFPFNTFLIAFACACACVRVRELGHVCLMCACLCLCPCLCLICLCLCLCPFLRAHALVAYLYWPYSPINRQPVRLRRVPEDRSQSHSPASALQHWESCTGESRRNGKES